MLFLSCNFSSWYLFIFIIFFGHEIKIVVVVVVTYLQSTVTAIFAGISLRSMRTQDLPSADWLSYLRTQLTVFVGRACLRSNFSKQFFHQKGTLKELHVRGNLFDCSQILTVASFPCKQQKRISEVVFFFLNTFFKSDLCTITPSFFLTYFKYVL